MAAQRATRCLSMVKRALGVQAPDAMSPHTHQPPVFERARGFATFDQAMMKRALGMQAPVAMSPHTYQTLVFERGQGGVDKCELRVHLCPPPWFYNIHGGWLIGRVNGVWVVHCVPKKLKSKKNVAKQQLQMVDVSTYLMMDEYWKSIQGVHQNPSLWIHENAKHSYYDDQNQMPDYFEQVVTMGSQIIALLWKLGFQPNAFYDRDHFLGALKKNQGVDVYLDFIEDPQTGIVYLDAYGFYFERTILPAGDWTKKDHPSGWVQKNGWFYLVYGL